MTIERKSRIPKAPKQDLVGALTGEPASVLPEPQAPEEPKVQPSPTVFSPVVKRPVRLPYTSKMDPELKTWASSYPDETMIEVVEKALIVLRTARMGDLDAAIDQLKQASRP